MLRVSTGVKGLDEMLGGGFPQGRIILLCGGPGTGKTILSIQYLMEAAKQEESGVYVTLEEPLKLIEQNVAAFGWDLKNSEKRGLLRTLDLHLAPIGEEFAEPMDRRRGEHRTSLSGEIVKAVSAIGAKHVAVDPITSIVVHEQRAGMKRRAIGQLFDNWRKLDCTVVFTSEVTPRLSDFYMEQFLADGVIRLDKSLQDFKLIKTIRIEKMRGVRYDEQPRQYVIDERGLNVYSTEPVNV